MSKEKIFLILSLAIVCSVLAFSISNKLTEKQDMKKYNQAIKFYQNEDYQNAYYNFGKISGFSSLKAPALFRQARCATILGDTNSAIRNYYILIKRFPNSELFSLSEYNLAVILYQNDDFNNAKKYFQHIIKNYNDKEVAIASKYYLGMIYNDKNLLLEYLKLSPSGRFAQNVIDKINKDKIVLSNSENLIVAKSCLEKENYKNAIDFYKKTSISQSWAGFAKAKFKTGDINQAKQFTVDGLKKYSANVDEKEIYDCIDLFLSTSNSKEKTLNFLASVNPNAKSVDYILYLLAKNSDKNKVEKIYEKIYLNFPNGDFAADSLYKLFYSKMLKRKYDEAIKLGKLHLTKYDNTNSAPAVMFWLGKIYEKKQIKDMARTYYKGILLKYPDSYYAIRANSKLHPNNPVFEKQNIIVKPVVFPIKNKSQANLAVKLAQLSDYDFVLELHENDKFVESWVEYQKGNYSQSAILARDEMKKLKHKPDFQDVRWRLVYPVHYYNDIKKYAKHCNPIIILSIIKEESHFNPKAQSPVGAKGLMQLMPQTANEIANSYGISNNLFDPHTNIRLGSLYYSQIKRNLNNKDISAIMAYNGGASSVVRWKNNIKYSDIDDFIEKIPYPETQEYLKKVMRTYWNYTKIY